MAKKTKWSIRVRKGYEDGWQPELVVPPQSFFIDVGGNDRTEEEVKWFAKMLRKAIKRIEKGESERRLPRLTRNPRKRRGK